jgi:hypothetical protein
MLKKDSSAPSRILPLNIPPSRSIPESAELQTKDQLIEKIKEWVKIDNEIRTLQTELNKRKENKKKVSTELMNVMKRNEIDVFDIKDGQIIYDKRNVKKPVTKAGLMSILSTYYNGDVVKAAEINQYIMDNREDVVREKIIRKSRGTYGSPRTPLP